MIGQWTNRQAVGPECRSTNRPTLLGNGPVPCNAFVVVDWAANSSRRFPQNNVRAF